MIDNSFIWLFVLLHCTLTPLSLSQTPQTQKIEGHAWRDIFNMSKCQPRWVLLNLLNEFPQFSDFLFKPPCVSVQRCAGCCLDEAQSCFPLQSHVIKMEVQVHKSKSFPELTEISVIQHSECECRPHANITVQASRSACLPCRPRRTLNPKNCKCVCEITEEQCNQRGRTLNRERCRCDKPRS